MPEVLYDSDNELILNMGPHHPATHGVLRFVVQTDGEVMRRAIPDIGFLHRGIEHIGELCTWQGFMPYTDRVDYLAAMFANQAWATAVEKLAGVEVPRRAELLRIISCELNRIANHWLTVGVYAMDTGAITPFPYGLRERELINDLLEVLCGQRLTYNYHRIGGVAWDAPAGWTDKVLEYLDHCDKVLPEFDRLISGNQIFLRRLADVITISAEDAIAYGLVGPNLRASGVEYDVRKDEPYGLYGELDFEVPVGEGWAGEKGVVGDCYDRYYVRLLEIVQSIKMIRQAIAMLEPGEVLSKAGSKLKKAPPGEAFARVESARGDMLVYVVSDGGANPYRARFRTGSFNSMSIIEKVSQGVFVADLVALIASFDVVAPEIDR